MRYARATEPRDDVPSIQEKIPLRPHSSSRAAAKDPYSQRDQPSGANLLMDAGAPIRGGGACEKCNDPRSDARRIAGGACSALRYLVAPPRACGPDRAATCHLRERTVAIRRSGSSHTPHEEPAKGASRATCSPHMRNAFASRIRAQDAARVRDNRSIFGVLVNVWRVGEFVKLTSEKTSRCRTKLHSTIQNKSENQGQPIVAVLTATTRSKGAVFPKENTTSRKDSQ